MGKFTFPVILVLVVGALAGLFLLVGKDTLPLTTETDNMVISQEPVHYHPELTIYVKGQQQLIPSNIGIGPSKHEEVHTHEDVPKIHYELTAAPITKQTASVGAFFKIWGVSFEGKVSMSVNGQPNNELFNYVIKDKDKVEVRYE